MNRSMHRHGLRVAFLVSFLQLIVTNSHAQGLMVDPKRVVMDNGARSGSVTITNAGKDSTTYSVKLQDMRMDDHGDLLALSDSLPPDSLSLKKMLRYYPHEITLGPHESQTIRVQVIKPATLPIGEYRSHMVVTPLPKPVPLEQTDTASSVHMKISVLLGSSMPVIYRNGTAPSTTGVTDLSVAYDTLHKCDMLYMNLLRTGNESVYCKVIATLVSPDGTSTRVGLISGIGVYVPLTKRGLKVPLQTKDITTKKGKILVSVETFTGNDKETELAHGELTL